LAFELPHLPFDYDLNFDEYQVISFGDFVASTGDTEGRTAVRNNFQVGNGFSVGALIAQSELQQANVTLVVGRNAWWGSGALLPTDSVMYVGGALNSTTYLDSFVYNSPCYGCLDSFFDAAQQCYVEQVIIYQSEAINAHLTIIPQTGGEFNITCDSYYEARYYITIDVSQFNQGFYYNLDQTCNSYSQYIVTITGTADIYFHGNNFPQVTGGVVYNIPGVRNVYANTQVEGTLLMPQATLSQSTGVIIGKVVACTIADVQQVNLPCEGNPVVVTTGAWLPSR